MKRITAFIFISVFLLTIFTALKPSFSLDTSQLTPTMTPKTPVTDYGDGSHRIIDGMYIHYSFEEFTLDGGGLGFNYVDNYNNLAYNLGIGILYLRGSSTDLDPQLDVYSPNLPINGNIGYRLLGNRDTSNLMVFGGIQWMYMWLVVTMGENDVYAYGPAYGPIFGAKAEIKMTPSVSLIPYYMFQHTIYDLTIELNGIAIDADIDPVTSHLFGFDIKFSGFSVGALLDALNNTDNNKITILFSYDLDYKSGNEDLNRGDEKSDDQQKTRRQKPQKKQVNVKE